MAKAIILANLSRPIAGASTFEMVVLYRRADRSRVVKSRIVQPGQRKSILLPNTATDVAITVARRQATPNAAFRVVSETLLPTADNVNIIGRPQRLIVDKPLT
ncbi:hypothetical protein [Marininema halotolerans]|uniref:Uncharacterized protein n=1 Tax=Marininema halotolerans TaxID=1155944 RepID=A0A1I6UUZ5_9BACL|nr:hypothetical protein [Marininema halotolerans]SFT05220.1 hypothetical protein SAMN05444972_1227 [Marininema halotolerans]